MCNCLTSNHMESSSPEIKRKSLRTTRGLKSGVAVHRSLVLKRSAAALTVDYCSNV